MTRRIWFTKSCAWRASTRTSRARSARSAVKAPRGPKIMERILAGQGKPTDLDLLLDLSENMTGKTICVLSDSCAAPVVSGIKKFRGEFEAYLAGKRQPVMVG